MSSRAVRLGLLGALSLSLTGCGSSDDEVTAYCVDGSSRQPDGGYRYVDDDECDDDHHSRLAGGYYWLYGPRLKGSHVYGGSSIKPSGSRIVSSKGTVIQRGGFGGGGSHSSGG